MKIAMFGIKGIPVPAGAENVAEQIGSRLVQRGHEVTIYVRAHYTPRELKKYKGMRLIHLPSIPTKNLDTFTHSFLACLHILLFNRPDVVHIHSTGSSIFALLPRLFGIKTVVQSHGLDWQRVKWSPLAKLYLRLTDYSTLFFPNVTTVVSKKMAAYYQTMTCRPVIYIPNGVEYQEIRPANLIHSLGLESREYILFAARFVPEKGAHYLIEAFSKVNTTKKLVLAGDGSYGDMYTEILKGHASDKIIFPGFIRGPLMEELLSNAYAFVLPSEIEGLSIGLLEAMSYGNCVLASDIEENREVLGEAGFTFESKNVVELKNKLEYLLQNKQEVQTKRDLAKERSRGFLSWEKVTDQIVSLYQLISKGTKER